MTPGPEVRRAAELLRSARRILVLTGAGVSAESGIPTFRGDGGLWRRHRPEELATPEAFGRDARLVWEWYQWRRDRVASVRPNAAHRAIARLLLERDGVTLVTQNVDGLHTLALDEGGGDDGGPADRPGGTEEPVGREEPRGRSGGDPSLRAPIELHGSIFRVRCTSCSLREERLDPVDASARDRLPRCTDCGALLRPDVVWFGEGLDPGVIRRARDAAAAADVALVAGTSAVVEPAASLPRLTLAGGGAIVEVNPDPTPLSALAEIRLREAAGQVLPGLVQAALREPVRPPPPG